MQYLTIWDLVLTPVYLLVLSYIAKRHRDKKYPVGHPLRKYYLPGLYVKFGGAIFIALVYQYYYGQGDTFGYFDQSKIINSALHDSLSTWMELLMRTSYNKDPKLYSYIFQMSSYYDPSTYPVSVITAVFGLFNGTTYIPIALLFAFVSYTGLWALFKTFTQIYPALHKYFAIAFLFLPSVIIWGSGIFKDTICIFALGWLTYTVFRIFISRDFSIRNLFFLILSIYLIALIKIYILLAFLPALALWLLLSYAHLIRSTAIRFIVTLGCFGITVAGFVFFSAKFNKELNKYSLDKIAATSTTTREYINYISGDEGSSYDLGNFSPTLTGMISKFPAAVNVTLFRPYIWESKKIFVFFSAIESLLFSFFTLFVFYQIGLRKAINIIFTDPNVLFCLSFSLIFAFAVGISTYNFGALSRYKIPCLPFYVSFLILLYKEKLLKKKGIQINRRNKIQSVI